MLRYSNALIQDALRLRTEGKTYKEINEELNQNIPKSTLSFWFRNAVLPKDYYMKISKLNKNNLDKIRILAVESNRNKRLKMLEEIRKSNLPVSNLLKDNDVAKIALAMLCLGEASKYKANRYFSLGSSDFRIIVIFLAILKQCYNFNLEKVRCTVQCRADQDTRNLEKYWMGATGIPKRLFYKTRIDPRTIGKPTLKKDYKGVLKVDYFDTKIQLDLESLADLIYNRLTIRNGPEV